MKKKILLSLLVGLFLVTSAALFTGCSEGMSGTDYASEVVSLYADYSKKFDEITDALANGQRVTATSLCDQAAEIIDQIDALEPPVAFKDEHKVISECCKKEKEKLDLEKEYLEIAKDEDNLTDEQNARLDEVKEQLSELSVQSEKFYAEVENIAGKALQTQPHDDKNLVGW